MRDKNQYTVESLTTYIQTNEYDHKCWLHFCDKSCKSRETKQSYNEVITSSSNSSLVPILSNQYYNLIYKAYGLSYIF